MSKTIGVPGFLTKISRSREKLMQYDIEEGCSAAREPGEEDPNIRCNILFYSSSGFAAFCRYLRKIMIFSEKDDIINLIV